MSDVAAMRMNALAELRKHSNWFIFLGIVFVIGGTFALFAPGVAGLTLTVVVAIALVFVGIMEIIQAWSTRSWGGFIWQLVMGLIMVIGGLAAYFNPVLGLLTLTIVVAAVFLAKGVFQVVLGLQMRPHAGWGWVLTAGIFSILVGLIIWIGWPVSSIWALGTLTGISLIFSGWSYVMLAMAAKRT